MGTFNQVFAIRHIVGNGHLAQLTCGAMSFACSIGPGGTTRRKLEGDASTPSGYWPLRYLMYRPDRLPRPPTRLPVMIIRPDLGWCDDPSSRHYNTLVTLPFVASHETLWRKDHLYDLVIVLGHNDDPPVAGKGSAIFMHLRRPDCSATQGCIALDQRDLLKIAEQASPGAIIMVP